MCELYAINSLRPVRANEHLGAFFQDADMNPDGWGLAWRVGDGVFLYKEELSALDSVSLRCLLDEPIRSTNVVAHIRNATRGLKTYNNCHPFLRRDANHGLWVIAHNGTMLDSRLIDGYGAWALGNTDSERVAIYLVDLIDDLIEEKGGPLTFGERFVALSHATEELSASNKLNLVIDDGEYTYVHTNTLTPTLYVRVNGRTAFFCTRPLDGSGWVELPRNRLIAYRSGRIERMGARHDNSIDEAAYLAALQGSLAT
jgi:glutamine amidotransferase